MIDPNKLCIHLPDVPPSHIQANIEKTEDGLHFFAVLSYRGKIEIGVGIGPIEAIQNGLDKQGISYELKPVIKDRTSA